MVILVRGWVNVQSCCETTVALETEALVIAFDFGSCRCGIGVAGEAFNFLAADTAGTRDDGFGGARRRLVAC